MFIYYRARCTYFIVAASREMHVPRELIVPAINIEYEK